MLDLETPLGYQGHDEIALKLHIMLNEHNFNRQSNVNKIL